MKWIILKSDKNVYTFAVIALEIYFILLNDYISFLDFYAWNTEENNNLNYVLNLSMLISKIYR